MTTENADTPPKADFPSASCSALLVIPKDAADTSRIEKLEKAGYLVIVTYHPEKVFVIEK